MLCTLGLFCLLLQAIRILRIGVAFDGISCWGREQDYKVYWPIGLMFSDPTRNVPFALGQ